MGRGPKAFWSFGPSVMRREQSDVDGLKKSISDRILERKKALKGVAAQEHAASVQFPAISEDLTGIENATLSPEMVHKIKKYIQSLIVEDSQATAANTAAQTVHAASASPRGDDVEAYEEVYCQDMSQGQSGHHLSEDSPRSASERDPA